MKILKLELRTLLESHLSKLLGLDPKAFALNGNLELKMAILECPELAFIDKLDVHIQIEEKPADD